MGSWVFVRGLDGSPVSQTCKHGGIEADLPEQESVQPARIALLALLESRTQAAAIVIERWQLSEDRDTRMHMPVLTPYDQTRETYCVVEPNVRYITHRAF